MDFNIGDVVKHNNKGIGVVRLIDGSAVWVEWRCGSINHSSSIELQILDKAP